MSRAIRVNFHGTPSLTHPPPPQQFSKVRSLRMDHWSQTQIITMLEGGNKQLGGFFDRHSLSASGSNAGENLKKRYNTKAALFYRSGMTKHVNKVAETGSYRGRKESRRLSEGSDKISKAASAVQKQHSI